MKEADWLTCGDPQKMINHLPGRRGYIRRLLLLGCACCRLVWERMPDERSREVVRTAERFADGEADEAEFTRATAAANRRIPASECAAPSTMVRVVAEPTLTESSVAVKRGQSVPIAFAATASSAPTNTPAG